MGAFASKAKSMIPGFSKDYTLEWGKAQTEGDDEYGNVANMTGLDDASHEDKKKTYLDACLKVVETYCTALAKEKQMKGTILCAPKGDFKTMKVKEWATTVDSLKLFPVGKEEADLEAAAEDPCSLVKAGVLLPWCPFTNAEDEQKTKNRLASLVQFLKETHGFGPGTQGCMLMWGSRTEMTLELAFDDPKEDCALKQMGLAHRMKAIAEGKPPGMGACKAKCSCLPCVKK